MKMLLYNLKSNSLSVVSEGSDILKQWRSLKDLFITANKVYNSGENGSGD
jgi:hypothetical protein